MPRYVFGTLAGASHLEGARDALAAAPDYTHLKLWAEPENEHDPKAVRVELDGQHVGYIGASKVPPGCTAAKAFHDHEVFWGSAVLVRNSGGNLRVRIET